MSDKPLRLGYLAAFLAGLALCGLNHTLFLFLNGAHHPVFDRLFLSITHLGNGAVATMLVLLWFPLRPRTALKCALAALTAGILAALLKEVIGAPRPPAVFGDHIHVLGRRLTGHSLPSGHTATAFGLAFALKGVVSRSGYRWALLAACLVGYSRIYTGVHFPVDVVAGAVIGWLGARATVPLWERLSPRLDPASRATELTALSLALVSGLWIALYEPMLPYNPVVLRVIGFGGATAAVLMAAVGIMRGTGR